jgi:tRNA threonylcarbamoyl adenosine modification protein (Sua5/YciO/YrdC/YwlC family)
MIQVIHIDKFHIDSKEIYEISEKIKNGAILIFPTDSVYALGCSLSNKEGINKILRITGKKEKHSKLSLICSSIKEVSQFTLPYSNHVFKTMNRYLPGPYTFVLKADKSVRKYFDNTKSEIGIRIPDNDVLKMLFKHLDEPLITTSLNKTDDNVQDYYIDPEEIAETFQHQVDLLIDIGIGNYQPSTILDCTGNEIEIIRQGVGIVD